jgi:type III secretory pathway lipoprotein EscJ
MTSVEIASFVHRHEAETALAFLEQAGIAAKLLADDCGGAHPGLLFSNPAKLLVPAEDVESARRILEEGGLPVTGEEG